MSSSHHHEPPRRQNSHHDNHHDPHHGGHHYDPHNVKVVYASHFKVIQEKTGIPGEIVVGALGVMLIFVLIGYLDVYITNFIGIVYPAYWSIKAIESKESDDDKQWLTYWVLFSLFSLVDLFLGSFLKFIPFYFVFKMIFLIWLMAPMTKGAIFIYDKILIKIFKKYESKLDELSNTINRASDNAVTSTKTYVKENQGKIITEGLSITQKIVETTTVEEDHHHHDHHDHHHHD